MEEHSELQTEFIEQDPKGYFVIKVDADKKEVVADHYSNENSLLNRITGATAKYIYKRIISLGFVSDVSHAAYLGHELRAAQFALEHSLPYEQDRDFRIPREAIPNTSLAAEATYIKAGKLVSIPDSNHDETVKVGGVEMSFKDLLRSRGICRVF
jgi:hypothetical protein